MTMYNTIGRLATKDIGRLKGLQMGIVEQSFKDFDFKIKLNSKSIAMTDSTPITQVERRIISELEGLLYNRIEFSLRKQNLKYSNIRIIKPKKICKIKLIVIRKYSNTKVI